MHIDVFYYSYLIIHPKCLICKKRITESRYIRKSQIVYVYYDGKIWKIIFGLKGKLWDGSATTIQVFGWDTNQILREFQSLFMSVYQLINCLEKEIRMNFENFIYEILLNTKCEVAVSEETFKFTPQHVIFIKGGWVLDLWNAKQDRNTWKMEGFCLSSETVSEF